MQEPNRAPDYTRDYWMDGQIDLRAYVALMLRRWWWIVGCAVVAAVAAFAVGLLRPPTYEAASMVLITKPRYQIQLEPRFETVEQWQPAQEAFLGLATSNGVLQSVVEGYQPSAAAQVEEWKLDALRGMAEATSEDDGSLFRLKVSSRSPEDAAGLANVWAEKLVDRGNQVFGDYEQDVTFFEERAAWAGERLKEAEQALVAFQARNRASIVTTQLSATLQAQSRYLADQQTITYVIRDIRGLRDQLVQQPEDRSLTLGDELTSLFLQVRAFDADALTPIELQISSAESLSQRSRAEQVAFLEDMVQTLQAKSTATDERLAELEPKILEHQEDLGEFRTEERALERAQTLAEETYMTLSRRLEEARIAARGGNGIVQVGSHAAVTEKPAGRRRLVNTVLAGVVGGMVGSAAVFVWEWWDEGKGVDERGVEMRS